LTPGKAMLEQTKNEIHKGWKPTRRADVPTIDQLLGSYIAQVESPSTQKRYRLSQEILRRHFGNFLITDVDAFMFDQLKEIRRNEGVTAAGINRDMALARAAFNFAVKRRILPYSPLNGVKFLNETKNRNPPHAISYAEEEKILMCCDMRLRTIVTTLLESGRVGIEALSLKWENVDLEEGTITVALSKTASGLRTLPMTSRLKSELEKWRTATASLSQYVFFQSSTSRNAYS
jgi:integrase